MCEAGITDGASFGRGRALLEVVRLAFEGDLGIDESEGGSVPVAPPSPPAPRSRSTSSNHGSTGSSARLVPGGPCNWCGVTATPQWRRPRGTNKLLCNACGIYYTRYGKLPEQRPHQLSHAHAAASKGSSAHEAAAEYTPHPCPRPQPRTQAHRQQDDGPEQPQPQAHMHAAAQHAPPPQQPQQRERPQVMRQATSSTSSLSGATPQKRKDAPQPEAELLRCLEEPTSTMLVDQPAHLLSGPGPLAQQHALAAAQLAQLQGAAGGGAAGSAGTGLAAAGAGGAAATRSGGALHLHVPGLETVLTVAPLDLSGLQLLAQQNSALLGLPGLISGGLMPGAGAGASGPTASAAAVAAAAAQWRHQSSALGMGMPFALQGSVLGCGGVLPIATSLFDATQAPQAQQPRLTYARAPKRHERLPVGESDDSNVSTDSNAGHGDGGAWHEDDEGGTHGPHAVHGPAAAAPTTTTTTGGTASTALAVLSSSPSTGAGPAFPLPPSLLHGHMGPPRLLAGASLLPMAAAAGLAHDGGGGPGGAPALPPLGMGAAAHGPLDAWHQPGMHLGNPGVILLPTRKSKGPRSRASSVTPSSSTQS